MSEQPQKTKKTAQPAPQHTTVKGNRLLLQGDRKFDYDERGNLIRERRGKGGKLVTYDPLGRRIINKGSEPFKVMASRYPA